MKPAILLILEPEFVSEDKEFAVFLINERIGGDIIFLSEIIVCFLSRGIWVKHVISPWLFHPR